ncbi:hypothetical protein HOLleu_44375 [Holothuria leucospilota]|uniref:Uncharacterized protein n=1 Tax=Holothuria leucospilota TaxID=206669 RepID=A0A9Q0Y8W8_HOLLE|nr:hypothetical protein HOLleu_44375 [Holothuria leucospilota]
MPILFWIEHECCYGVCIKVVLSRWYKYTHHICGQDAEPAAGRFPLIARSCQQIKSFG